MTRKEVGGAGVMARAGGANGGCREERRGVEATGEAGVGEAGGGMGIEGAKERRDETLRQQGAGRGLRGKRHWEGELDRLGQSRWSAADENDRGRQPGDER